MPFKEPNYKKLYDVWYCMKRRCFNKSNHNYKNYGGRGITVCQRWLDFHNFLEDMSAGYSKGLSLDRIDCNGNYEPNNCRWATTEIQSYNKRVGKGYFKHGKKFIAVIRINKKRILLGSHETELEAHRAYMEARTARNLKILLDTDSIITGKELNNLNTKVLGV
jgi:hypothetical protein